MKRITIKTGELLSPTRPMGWNSWGAFGKGLTDSLIRLIPHSMVSTSMRVNIDDFWQLIDRDKEGNIQINKVKFPG